MIWLLCGLMLAASLFYVFYMPGKLFLGPEKTRAGYLRERKDAVYENLRDLNFEYKAGKVPDADYASLKSSLQDEAATTPGRNCPPGKSSPTKRNQILKAAHNRDVILSEVPFAQRRTWGALAPRS